MGVSKILSYDDAVTIIQSATIDPITLPAYAGGTDDLGYLKAWVLELIQEIYGVSGDVFEVATLAGTTILRDFVHRGIYHAIDPVDFADIIDSPEYLGNTDVAQSFRYAARGLCAQAAWQLYEVFRAFGYSTADICTVAGNYDDYTDSHVTVQVYLEDIGKFVVQDPTYNFFYRSGDQVLSLQEAQQANLQGALEFDGLVNYRSFVDQGYPDPQITVAQVATITESYLKTIAWWQGATQYYAFDYSYLFPEVSSSHDPAAFQGKTVADFTDIPTEILALGKDATVSEVVTKLNSDGYYASGFSYRDADNNIVSWATVRIADGTYVSVGLNGQGNLRGSYDQLYDELTGGPALNAGKDLSFLFGSVSIYFDGGSFDPDAVTPAQSISATSLEPLDVTGTDLAEILIGNAASNTLRGGLGADVMKGYAGDDIYFVDDLGDQVQERSSDGYDTVIANVDYALGEGASIELLRTWGSASTYSVNLTGNDLVNTIQGNAGANVIDGGAGADHLWGYGGDDVYVVDDPGDRVFETDGEGFDSVVAKVDYRLATGSSVELLRASGPDGSDPVNLTGNEHANTIEGNAGANRIDGGAGADRLSGFGGDDLYLVDDPGDRVIEAEGEGYDTVITNTSYRLPAGSAIEMLRTWGSAVATPNPVNLDGNEFGNVIVGNDGTNRLDGGAGDDTIWGYGGADELVGGDGADVLRGGDGADRFVFQFANDSPASGFDKIVDFEPGVDRIDLSQLAANLNITLSFDGNASASGLKPFSYGSFVEGADTVAVVDVTGDGQADLWIHIWGAPTLGSGDFQV